MASPVQEGIITDGSLPVESLVRDVFANSICDNFFNIRAVGNPAGIGYFQQGQDVIGLERGVILSTGPIRNAEGPNDKTDQSGDLKDPAGDADLHLLSGGSIHDAVGLEFDFIPLDSFVMFRYVFASEEYCEFVGSDYNDVFGFFISGPGISGPFSDSSRNMALIPGSDDYVAINTVNHQTNAQYFVRNERPADAQLCGLPPLGANNFWTGIQYDGFTRRLEAYLKLIPCETYHIRLVVADVADSFYDSAVFLEAESFNIGESVTMEAVGDTRQPTLAVTEGCSEGFFRFSRSNPDSRSAPLTVRYVVAPQSTAVPGADFAPFPGVITIPVGEVSAVLPVSAFNDHLPEAAESIVLQLDIPCACYEGEATLQIADAPPITLSLPDAYICQGQQTTLSPVVAGGTPPFTYLWSTGETTPEIGAVFDGLASVYRLRISDQCGNWVEDSCTVQVSAPPSARLSGSARICAGDTAFVTLEMTGAPPWQVTLGAAGQAPHTLQDLTTSPYDLPVTHGGRYEILAFSDAHCTGEGSGEAWVEEVRLAIDPFPEEVSCADRADGRIGLEVSGGTPPYRFNWGHAADSSGSLQSLPAGWYQLTVTDAGGCRQTLAIEVPSPEPLSEVAFTCDDLTGGDPLLLTAAGGTPPYRYSVDGASFEDEALFSTLLPGEHYALLIRDARDCRLEQSFVMPAAYDDGMVDLPRSMKLKMGDEQTMPVKLLMPPSLLGSVRWLPDEDLSCASCLMPEVTATRSRLYTLRVVDVFGCTDEATIVVEVDSRPDLFVPSGFSPNGDGVNDRLSIFADARQVERILHFEVFDRWGNQVFSARDFPPNDDSLGWDGAFRGRRLPAGVFAYFLQVRLAGGEETILRGSVTLMR